MYDTFIRERINSLRMLHNLSEYQLSLELGHSQGYIQSITSGRTLPSMTAFLEICDYFKLTPAEFFEPSISNPSLYQSVVNDAKQLPEKDLTLVSLMLKRLNTTSANED